MKKKYLECGKIVSTHGIRGEIKVQHWCDSPEYLCAFKALYTDKGEKKLTVERARPHKNMVILKLSGVDGIDEAVTLRGQILYIDREDAPRDDAFFLQDLLGLDVRDADTDFLYGKVSDVMQTGANDVYEITDENGIKRLIPAIPDVVADMDMEKGLMRIRPLRGLFDDAH
ncbi:MAG: ribosome maturation factor RimM [Oscillospiraceae bacterium]|jgi:16S rRNA processing protein RimM|nr:ribosome maturation factor RimM [Oscillospiraceae bacterium]